jgi:hypothetical protein
VAHIIDWPKCVELASEQITGRKPPEGWLYEEAVRYFHDLGNVLPLCPNCHGLYDGIHYTDITECEIRRYRDDAVQQPETLARLIDFVGVELSGRPNRCTHKVAGRRKHSRTVNLAACTWPLIWIARGYELGVLTDNPHLTVNSAGAGHYHVRLDTTEIRLRSARLGECGHFGEIWRRSPQ